MIHVLAFITAKPGKRAEILENFRANMATCRAEKGCIEYGPVIDAEGSAHTFGDDTFVVVEKWATMEDLKAHGASPHMAAYSAKNRDLVAKREVHILKAAL